MTILEENSLFFHCFVSSRHAQNSATTTGLHKKVCIKMLPQIRVSPSTALLSTFTNPWFRVMAKHAHPGLTWQCRTVPRAPRVGRPDAVTLWCLTKMPRMPSWDGCKPLASIILTRPTFHGPLIANVVLATTDVAQKPKPKFAKENLKSLLKKWKAWRSDKWVRWLTMSGSAT